MSCQAIEPWLVTFHFGEVEDSTRAEIEAHLLGCRACLASYLSLKREIETAASGPRPSEAARQRLRRAVALEIGALARPRAWWERPLACSLAGAAVLAALALVIRLDASPGTMPHGAADPPAAVHGGAE